MRFASRWSSGLETTTTKGPGAVEVARRHAASVRPLAIVAALALAIAGCPPPTNDPDGGGEDTGGGQDSGGSTDTQTLPDEGTSSDPCGDVPTTGVCMGTAAFRICTVPSDGRERRTLDTITCATGEECRLTDGEAECVPTAMCSEGDTECGTTTQLRTCTDGAWVMSDCATRCVGSGMGAACAPDATMAAVSARVTYEYRPLNGAMNGFGAPVFEPLRGASVAGYRGAMLIGTTITSLTDGSFTLQMPAPAIAGDRIVVALWTPRTDDANQIAYAVLDPGLAAGVQPSGDQTEVDAVRGITSPRPWSWTFDATDITATLEIPESGTAGGSGAASVFDYFGVSYREAARRHGVEGQPALIWMGTGVEWKCGACVNNEGRRAFRQRFSQQIFYLMNDERSYFSRPVIAHEAGHWVMNSYGRNVGEGGGHSNACPSFPGLAWNEGFATWFGQSVVNSPIYYDNQGGVFWSNLAMRARSAGNWGPRPTPTGQDVERSSVAGVLQRVSEDEVSAMMWALAGGAAEATAVHRAIASPRMRTPPSTGRFERGYSVHWWGDFQIDGCLNPDPQSDGETTTMFADFLDALLCGGFPAATVDAAIEPTTHYPFPTSATMCR